MPSGAFEVGASGNSNQQKWRLRLEYSYYNSVEDNKSYIDWTLKVYAGTNDSHVDDSSPYYQITDFDSKHYGAYNFGSTGWYTLGTFSDYYNHSDEGERTTPVHAIWYSGNDGSSYTPLSIEINDTLTFDTIPRKSSISCGSGDIGGGVTVSLAKYSSSFNHKITYAFGSDSGTVTSGYTGTNFTWILPTSFYAQIPNAKSGTGTLTCYTYSGSTPVGSTTCSFTATAAEASCKPSISATVVDTNSTTTALTGDSNKLIKYYSNANVSISATAKNSASIAGYTTNCGDGKSFNGASGTLNGVESGSFACYISDSRGYGNSVSISKTLVNYIKLTLTPTITPPDSQTNIATVKWSGNYFNNSFGAVANNLRLYYRYKKDGGSYTEWTNAGTPTISGNTYTKTITISNLPYTSSYVFQINATDKLNNLDSPEITVKTTPIFDWGENDFSFNVPVYIKGNLIKTVVNHGCPHYIDWEQDSSGEIHCWLHKQQTLTGSTPSATMGGYCSYLDVEMPVSSPNGWTGVASGRLGTGVGSAFVFTINATTIKIFVIGSQNSDQITLSGLEVRGRVWGE